MHTDIKKKKMPRIMYILFLVTPFALSQISLQLKTNIKLCDMCPAKADKNTFPSTTTQHIIALESDSFLSRYYAEKELKLQRSNLFFFFFFLSPFTECKCRKK